MLAFLLFGSLNCQMQVPFLGFLHLELAVVEFPSKKPEHVLATLVCIDENACDNLCFPAVTLLTIGWSEISRVIYQLY